MLRETSRMRPSKSYILKARVQFKPLIVFELANNHMGSVDHG